MRGKYEIAYLLLPLLLWPLSFLVFKSEFIYAMLGSTFLLAMLTIYRYRKSINWNTGSIPMNVLIGIGSAAVLYLAFVLGYLFLNGIGFSGGVANVYSSIYGQNSGVTLVVALALIGVFEEIYWRGGIMSIVKKRKLFLAIPWTSAVLYYTAVHLLSLNLVLVGAAFVVGLVLAPLAYKRGILPSIIAHIVWIEAIVVFLPIIHP